MRLPSRRGSGTALAGLLLLPCLASAGAADDLGPGEPGWGVPAPGTAATGHDALVQQQGEQNTAWLTQTGEAHWAMVLQAGADNEAGIAQHGGRHRAEVSQAGQGNQVEILQLGWRQVLRIHQAGDLQHVRVTQSD